MKKPHLSPEQTAYLTALAIVRALTETAKSRFAAEKLGITRDMPRATTERVFLRREQIEAEIGLYDAKRALRAAEEAMVRWGVEHACRFSPAHATVLRETEQKAKRSLAHWDRLVAIVVKLAA